MTEQTKNYREAIQDCLNELSDIRYAGSQYAESVLSEYIIEKGTDDVNEDGDDIIRYQLTAEEKDRCAAAFAVNSHIRVSTPTSVYLNKITECVSVVFDDEDNGTELDEFQIEEILEFAKLLTKNWE